jgi:prevent-host-death family protein
MKRNTYSVSEFKAKSLGLLEQISRSGESIIVTKRGKPIAKVIPMGNEGEKLTAGKLRDTLIKEIDIVTPFGAKLWKAAEPK